MDIASGYPFEAGQFDVVFSHLTLHCIAPSLMPSVMAEVCRVLKPNCLLIFDCKTTADPNFGVGEEVEPNFFISPKCHARHLFTEDFARQMLEGAFTVITLYQGSGQTYDKQSDVLRCVAQQLGVSTDECIFIDDHAEYLDGAREVGMPSAVQKY
jgi:SAM-dependent methyltransferase